MKQIAVIFISVLMLMFVSTVPGCAKSADAGDSGQTAEKKLTFETNKQKTSYTIGYNIGNNLKTMGDDFELDIVLQGIKDAFLTGKAQMSSQEMQKTFEEFQQKLNKKRQDQMKKQQEQRKAQGEKNKTGGEAFLKENAKKEGIKVTTSGLQYQVLKAGNGPKPKATDRVKVHYRGSLIDGTEFDSSYKRGKPNTFALNRVVPGWTEGIQLMTVGSKYKLFIPPKLGYKERGAGRLIGPNAVLIFEVELLGIEPPAEKKPPAKKNPAK